METLIKELKKISGEKNLNFDSDNAVYPFNKFEFLISQLLGTGKITLNQYLEIRNSYLKRNKNLYLFGITAPRTFGETWAQNHLKELVPELQTPSTALDKNYSGHYDFWCDGIRIEVKASRAVLKKSGGTLIEKALSVNSTCKFNMNFQQIKPDCCDVFVWIAVWRDAIKYWVLSSMEVERNPYYSKNQHHGNTGEGQLWLKESNIEQFAEYEVSADEILSKIKEKGA